MGGRERHARNDRASSGSTARSQPAELPLPSPSNARLREDVERAADEIFWLRHFIAGLLMYITATVLAMAYLGLTPDGPHRSLLWVMVVISLLSSVTVVALPRKAIVRSPRRLSFFMAWSTFTCVFAAVVVGIDGGITSPLAFYLFLPEIYACLAYPPRAAGAIGVLSVVAGLVVGGVSGDPASHVVLFAGSLTIVTAISASVARQIDQQQQMRKALTDQLSVLAERDGLTGCLNHRAFYERLTAELARSARHGHDLCVLLADVDGFKQINDRYGHLCGDTVLREIATAFRRATRAADAVGRLGGDEFAVLLTEATLADGKKANARFLDAMRDASARLPVPIAIDVSVGMAHVPSGTILTADEAVGRADADLYAKKRLGAARRDAPAS